MNSNATPGTVINQIDQGLPQHVEINVVSALDLFIVAMQRHRIRIVGTQIDHADTPRELRSFDREAYCGRCPDDACRRGINEFEVTRLSDDQHMSYEIGRANVRTPVTNAHLVCSILID